MSRHCGKFCNFASSLLDQSICSTKVYSNCRDPCRSNTFKQILAKICLPEHMSDWCFLRLPALNFEKKKRWLSCKTTWIHLNWQTCVHRTCKVFSSPSILCRELEPWLSRAASHRNAKDVENLKMPSLALKIKKATQLGSFIGLVSWPSPLSSLAKKKGVQQQVPP